MVTRALFLKLADSALIERMVHRNGMSAGFARRFVAGETIEEAVQPVCALNARGITATLDYLGENVTRAEEAAESVAYYHRLFAFIAEHRLQANVSLKLTQLGLGISDDLAYQNMGSVLDEAARYQQFVRIDMEGSAYTQRTLDLFYRLWADYKNTGPVIQSYLYRSEADVSRLLEAGARIRLVKGAYNEPKEVAFQRKSDVDRNYVTLMQSMLKHGNYPAIATHDTRIIQTARDYAHSEQIPTPSFEFQMLFGIRRDLQESLAKQGHPVRIYVPFGTQWYSYFMRRLAERPANVWFVLKNIVRH